MENLEVAMPYQTQSRSLLRIFRLCIILEPTGCLIEISKLPDYCILLDDAVLALLTVNACRDWLF
jgi:hypothetical protein